MAERRKYLRESRPGQSICNFFVSCLTVSAFGGLGRLFPIVAGKVLWEMALSRETACLALRLVSICDILEEPGLKSIQRLSATHLDGFGS